MRVVRIRPGPRTPHRHPHSCEVMFVAQGDGRFWEGDTVHQVRAGDVLFVPTGVPHATVCVGDTDIVLACFFPRRDLPSNIEELPGPVRH
ncbi:cupin domain-containing protein [Georgenia yuyongxinii]